MTSRHALAILAALVLALAVAAGAAETPLNFVPVQNGPAGQAEQVLPYVPDRVLVQLHDDPAKAMAAVPMELGAELPGARFGLPGLDRLAAEAGVTRIARPFLTPASGATRPPAWTAGSC